MQTLLTKIAEIILAPLILVGSLFTPTVIKEQPQVPIVQNTTVGAALPQATGVFETSLAAAISSSASSMTLTSNSVRGGGFVAGYTCFTIDEGSAQAEVVCGTVLSTAVSSLTRGISYADGITSVAANKFAHRRGANVKITDFPLVQILKAQNNGDVTFPNPLKYDTGIGPVASSDIADKEYVLSVVSGGTVSFEKVVLVGNAGETVTTGNLLYLNSSDNEWYKTDADTASSVENVLLGIAQGAGTDGVDITGGILIKGLDTNQTGLTPNTIYYAGNTAGGISTSAGTKEVTVGIAKTTTSIIFIPRYNQQLTEDQQDALVGTSGTPSLSNPYATKATTDTLNTSKALVADIQTFTSSGTWTMPAGAKSVLIEAIGGGGGGGGIAANGGGGNNSAGGGGGGSYSKIQLPASVITSPVTVTIPNASAGGVGGNDGAIGGNVTFGSYLTGYGGGAGGKGASGGAGNGGGGGGGGLMGAGVSASAGTAGAGGLPTGGAIGANYSSFGGGGGGNSSAGGLSYQGGGGGGMNEGSVGGASTLGGGGGGGGGGNTGAAGGVSTFGGAGGAGGAGGQSYGNANNNGSNGVAPGGGGGGAGSYTGAVNGGAGAKGQITVTTFF